MNKKKIILISVAVVLAVAVSLTLYFTWYMNDSKDTEELFRKNVSDVGYENTIEAAVPQTALYSIVKGHFEADSSDGKKEKKAIIIGYDGCRADVLSLREENSSGISAMLKEGASINLSYCGGVNFPETNIQDTSTAPGWCSILTGVWADKHGITGNDITKSMEYKTLLTSLTEEKTIDSATFITRWAGHFSRENATYLNEKDYCEKNNLPVSFNILKNDKASHAFTLEEIKKAECSDFIFVIYEPTDATGHSYGFSVNNPRYEKAFRQADGYGYEVIESIKSRESFENEDWLIIITSDHGGIGTKHGDASIQERMTFIVMNKDI